MPETIVPLSQRDIGISKESIKQREGPAITQLWQEFRGYSKELIHDDREVEKSNAQELFARVIALDEAGVFDQRPALRESLALEARDTAYLRNLYSLVDDARGYLENGVGLSEADRSSALQQIADLDRVARICHIDQQPQFSLEEQETIGSQTLDEITADWQDNWPTIETVFKKYVPTTDGQTKTPDAPASTNAAAPFSTTPIGVTSSTGVHTPEVAARPAAIAPPEGDPAKKLETLTYDEVSAMADKLTGEDLGRIPPLYVLALIEQGRLKVGPFLNMVIQDDARKIVREKAESIVSVLLKDHLDRPDVTRAPIISEIENGMRAQQLEQSDLPEIALTIITQMIKTAGKYRSNISSEDLGFYNKMEDWQDSIQEVGFFKSLRQRRPQVSKETASADADRYLWLLNCIYPVLSRISSVEGADRIVEVARKGLGRASTLEHLDTASLTELQQLDLLALTPEQINQIPYGNIVALARGDALSILQLTGVNIDLISNLPPSLDHLDPEDLVRVQMAALVAASQSLQIFKDDLPRGDVRLSDLRALNLEAIMKEPVLKTVNPKAAMEVTIQRGDQIRVALNYLDSAQALLDEKAVVPAREPLKAPIKPPPDEKMYQRTDAVAPAAYGDTAADEMYDSLNPPTIQTTEAGPGKSSEDLTEAEVQDAMQIWADKNGVDLNTAYQAFNLAADTGELTLGALDKALEKMKGGAA